MGSRLLFNNGIGKLYDDKIIVKKNKLRIESIEKFDLFFYLDKRLNILFFVIGILGIITTVLVPQLKYLNSYPIGLFFLFILMSMVFKQKKYYLKIITVDKEITIKIKKREKEFAKQLMKEYWSYSKNRKQ